MNSYILDNILFEFGSNGNNVPYINISIGNDTYNILSMLENGTVLSVIFFMRDLVGYWLILCAVWAVVQNIPFIIHGKAQFFKYHTEV